MADEIRVDQKEAEEKAAGIESASGYFQVCALVPQDTRTTIPANENGRSAYGRSQSHIQSLGGALDQEVTNIRSLNAAFAEFDKMMGELKGLGSRHMTIRGKER